MKNFTFKPTNDHPLAPSKNTANLIKNNNNNAAVEGNEVKMLNAGEVQHDDNVLNAGEMPQFVTQPVETNAVLQKSQPIISLTNILIQPVSHLTLQSRSLVTNYFNLFKSNTMQKLTTFQTTKENSDELGVEFPIAKIYRTSSYESSSDLDDDFDDKLDDQLTSSMSDYDETSDNEEQQKIAIKK